LYCSVLAALNDTISSIPSVASFLNMTIHQKRVLLIEDEPEKIGLLSSLLASQAEWHLTPLSSLGPLIEQSLSAEPGQLRFDVALLDWHLLDLPGLQAIQVLRSLMPDLPIIILADSQAEELVLQAISPGVQDYLIDDYITAQSLTKTLRHAMRRKTILKRLRLRRSSQNLEKPVGRSASSPDLYSETPKLGEAPSAVAPLAVAPLVGTTATIQVLMIEDNPADASLVRQILARAGGQWKCAQAETLTEARDIYQDYSRTTNCTQSFDVALLDLNLIHTQGLETVAEFRQALPHLPFVVLTGLDSEELGHQAMARGAQSYLVKDKTTISQLIGSLQQAVSHNQLKSA
jgi:CheY-like chemotaxis protein